VLSSRPTSALLMAVCCNIHSKFLNFDITNCNFILCFYVTLSYIVHRCIVSYRIVSYHVLNVLFILQVYATSPLLLAASVKQRRCQRNRLRLGLNTGPRHKLQRRAWSRVSRATPTLHVTKALMSLPTPHNPGTQLSLYLSPRLSRRTTNRTRCQIRCLPVAGMKNCPQSQHLWGKERLHKWRHGWRRRQPPKAGQRQFTVKFVVRRKRRCQSETTAW